MPKPPIRGGIHVTCDAHFLTQPRYSSQTSCVKIWLGMVEPIKSYRGNIKKQQKTEVTENNTRPFGHIITTRNTLRVQIFTRRAKTSAKAKDRYQNLMARYLYHPQSFLKISSKFIHKFSSNMLIDRQTTHGSLPKSNQFFLISFLTFPENFIKIRPKLF